MNEMSIKNTSLWGKHALLSYTSGKHILNRIDILLFLFPVVSLRGLCYNILEIKMHEPITYSQ